VLQAQHCVENREGTEAEGKDGQRVARPMLPLFRPDAGKLQESALKPTEYRRRPRDVGAVEAREIKTERPGEQAHHDRVEEKL
jgi:hypothetical protein